MAFGGVWKESLTELSGGQRSLLALSLILAMLLFKPAPIYILDEVSLCTLRCITTESALSCYCRIGSQHGVSDLKGGTEGLLRLHLQRWSPARTADGCLDQSALHSALC